MTKSKEKYENLAKESQTEITNVIRKDSISSASKFEKDQKLPQKEIDSILNELDQSMQESFIPIPESARKKIIEEAKKEAKDTTKTKEKNNIRLNFLGDTRLTDFSKYNKDFPDSKIDVALDSLGYEKNFTNRLLFTKAKSLNAITKDQESTDKFLSEVLSYGSIAIFVFLPFFTLFLKFFYIRRKYTYIDHLIFVFHGQTVFFMLFSIFLLLNLFALKPEIWVFIVLFLLYLIIAMKKFYQQGYFKTILKFLLLNISYTIISGIGVTFLFIISFILF